MAVSKEDILETIANMTVMDVVDLITAMEAKFGVTAARSGRPSGCRRRCTGRGED
jgi:ribosomal protein L7/L12